MLVNLNPCFLIITREVGVIDPQHGILMSFYYSLLTVALAFSQITFVDYEEKSLDAARVNS